MNEDVKNPTPDEIQADWELYQKDMAELPPNLPSEEELHQMAKHFAQQSTKSID